MGVPRSSYYRDSRAVVDDTALVERMHALAEDWPHYGYRRMAAQLRAEGLPINRKRVARLMRLHGLCVRPRRRYVVTTSSDHDGPIFPNLARTMTPEGPDQLWVADITYIGLTSGTFVYLAIVLDAWSRRVVGYALARLIDARLTMDSAPDGARDAAAPGGLHAPLGSRRAVRCGEVPDVDVGARPRRLDGPTRQSV